MSETAKIAEARTPAPERDTTTDSAPDAEPRAGELLIEEVSIDGMCGVY
jgi:mycofactocin precursor